MMNDDLKKIRDLSNANFRRMLGLIELGIEKWWTASAVLAIAYDVLEEEQKEQIRKIYKEKYGKFPDVETFLKLGSRENKFKQTFFLPYENHIRHHESDSKLTNPDPDCIICSLLIEEAGYRNGEDHEPVG